MEKIYFIFILTVLSFGYGERYLCKEDTNQHHNVNVDVINEPAILIIPSIRPDQEWKRECFWRIGKGSFHIIFEKFHLFDSVDCYLESLELRFTGYDQDKTMVFCGTSYPKELHVHHTKTDYFDIVYSWRASIRKSFKIIIRKSSQLTTRLPQLNVSSTPMYIYSPGYPHQYNKNLDMKWTLTANDNRKRIMLDFIFLKTKDDVLCKNDFIRVKGDNTNILTCGHQAKHLVALYDSSVNITFKTDGYEEDDGFIMRYYTEPKNKESCVREGLTFTALPYKPTKLQVTKKPSDQVCTWVIKANTSDHVIIFEVLSYSVSPSPSSNWKVMLWVKDTPRIDPSGKPTIGEIFGINDIGSILRYYRSKNPAISVQLIDTYGVSMKNFILSYYSLPQGEIDDTMLIGNKPSYIWFNPSIVRKYIKLKAESGCIALQANFAIPVVKERLEVYDGESSEARDLINFRYAGNELFGSKQFMFIRIIPRIFFRRRDSFLLQIHSTDKCESFAKKLVGGIYPPFITIPSPRSLSRNTVYNYEISASQSDSVLYIRGIVYTSGESCESRVEFYHSNKRFYKWCVLGHFSKSTSFNKIQFSFYFDEKKPNARYEVTVIEVMKSQVSNHSSNKLCNGNQTAYPVVGEANKIYLSNDQYMNFDCLWLIIAPLSYEIKLRIKDITMYGPYSMASLELYNGKEYRLESEIFHYSNKTTINLDKEYVSRGGVLLLHILSYNISAIVDVDIRYSLTLSSFTVLKNHQTYRFSRSLDTVPVVHTFTKAKEYANYRMILSIQTQPNRYTSEVGFISFTNVINNGKYYPDYKIKEESITLYGVYDAIIMNIYNTTLDHFEVHYALEKIGYCKSRLTPKLYATDYFKTVATPNYPGHNDTYCEWEIYAGYGYVVSLEILYLDLGTTNASDHVEIFDDDMVIRGRNTGSNMYTYNSSLSFLTVTYISDSPYSQPVGALIRYKRIPSNRVSTPDITVTCLIVAGVVIVVCFVIICIFRKRRKKRNRPRRTSNPSPNINHPNNNFILRPPDDTTSSPPAYSEVQLTVADIPFPGPLSAGPPPSYDALPRQFEIPNNSVEGVDNSLRVPPGNLPPLHDGLPSYEDSGQFEILNSSKEGVDNL